MAMTEGSPISRNELQASSEQVERINGQVGGVLVRSSRGGRKLKFYEAVFESSQLTPPVKSVAPVEVPEDRFNDITVYPEIVAAMKTLQPSGRRPMMLRQVFGNIPEKPVVDVANDVMVDFELGGKHGWMTYNKLSDMDSKVEIWGFLRAMLQAPGFTEGGFLSVRVRMGQAVFSSEDKTGVLARTKNYFRTELYDDADVAAYVFGLRGAHAMGINVMSVVERLDRAGVTWRNNSQVLFGPSLDQLKAVNAGCLWEHPVLATNIYWVDNEPNYNHMFGETSENVVDPMQRLHARLQGAAFETPVILTDALLDFRCCGSEGGATAAVAEDVVNYPEMIQNTRWLGLKLSS